MNHFQRDPCVWHQCINPPLPDDNDARNLKFIWDGVTPYEFGEQVRYECKNQALWFEEDRDITHFELECLPDGAIDIPVIWPKCVHSKLVCCLITYYNN